MGKNNDREEYDSVIFQRELRLVGRSKNTNRNMPLEFRAERMMKILVGSDELMLVTNITV